VHGVRGDSGATGSRRRRALLVGVAGIAALVVGSSAWKPVPAPEPVAAPAPTRSVTVSFRTGEPVLRSILEPAARVSAVTTSPRASTPRPIHRRVVGPRPLRVLVVGDSVGSSFGRGLDVWAHTNSNVQVLNESRSWCSLGRGSLIAQGFTSGPSNDGCAGWGTRWSDAVRSFDPDVVFVLFSIWEVSPRQLPDRTDWLQPGAPALDAWQLSEYQDAADVLSARGAPIVWFTIPCEDEPIAVESPLWYVNRRTIPALAQSRRAVHVVDLDHELCRNGATNDYAGVRDARPDGAHFSVAGAVAVSKWVMPIVVGAVPNPPAIAETDPRLPRGATRRAG
jgi:SGNH domain (fused to AT3 domains)